MKKTAGFTLIELIVVVVILAVLGVVAAPKFIRIGTDARGGQLDNMGTAMETALSFVYSQAVIEGQDVGEGEITINGVTVPLLNGYPAVDGSDSFDEINEQVQVWLDIDSVSKLVIISDPSAAPFFIDKASSANQIYIFYADAPTTGNRTEYGCQVRYQNPPGQGPSVRVLTDAC